MNTKILLILFLLFGILSSCKGQQGNKELTSSSKKYSLPIDTAFVPSDSNQFYFPLDVFKDTSLYDGHDTFVVTWYSQHLFAMREPVIFADKSKNEIYRFTWLRTFHNPIAIRMEKRGDSYMLYWKLCNGAGGYDPGLLSIDKYKIIDKAIWDEFQKLLTQTDFWAMKTNENESGFDGSQWILEGKTAQQYHVVDRWTPSEKSKYYQCCNFLINQTDLEIDIKDKY